MIQKFFTVYDQKANAYLSPWLRPTFGMAVRDFANCINSPDHHFGKNPHDYTLYQLGTFDDNTCKIDVTDTKMLGNGVEFVERNEVDLLNEQTTVSDEPSVQPSTEG